MNLPMNLTSESGEVAEKPREADTQALRPRAAKTMLVYLIAWAILLWPPLLNGAPFMMPDSTTYIRGADAVAYNLTGHRTAWSGELFRKFAPPRHEPTAQADQLSGAKDTADVGPIVLAGRSIYYGALPYLSYLVGSLWFAVAIQALLTVACIALTLQALRNLQGRRATRFELLLLVAFLALLTPVGYFVGFVMPDLTTAFAILATAHILLLWSSMDRARRWFWTVLLVFSLASHGSNLLMVGAMAFALLVLSPIRRLRPRRRSILLIVTAVLAAVALEMAFSFGVKSATGAAPVRPPFVTARLVEDGPGYRYLRDHCPQSGFLLCNYFDRLPQPSDNVLWEKRRDVGVFSALPPAEARALALEQGRFVVAVLADRPLEVAMSSFLAAARQAAQVGLGEFNYTGGTRDHFAEKLPGPVLGDVRRSAAFNGDMPVAFVSAATIPVTLLSLLAIAWTPLAGRGRQTGSSAFALIVCVLLALNVAICGVMSTPHERYLMRAIWLLPLVAICLLPPLVRISRTASG
jgi:hypothetical protein